MFPPRDPMLKGSSKHYGFILGRYFVFGLGRRLECIPLMARHLAHVIPVYELGGDK